MEDVKSLIDYYIARANFTNTTIDYDKLSEVLSNVKINVTTTQSKPSFSYYRRLIDYYIDHDYNITHHIFGGGSIVGDRTKRFTFAGLFESSILAIVRPILHIIHEFFFEFIEPLLERLIDIFAKITLPLVKTIFTFSKTLFEHIYNYIIENVPEQTLIDFFERFLKFLYRILHVVVEKFVDILINTNTTHKIFEFVALYLILFYYFKAYFLSLIITIVTFVIIGIERTDEHTIMVILIFTFLLIRCYTNPRNGYY